MVEHSVPSGEAVHPAEAHFDQRPRLRFGSDPCREMIVWWSTSEQVGTPSVLVGTSHTGYSRAVPAQTITYRDVVSGDIRYLHHAVLTRLCPGAKYLYLITHDHGAAQRALSRRETFPTRSGAFRTAPEFESSPVREPVRALSARVGDPDQVSRRH
jgi:hypothetical protein